jgi:hypothetical protein
VVLGHGACVAKVVDSCVFCRRRDYLIFLLIYAILVLGWWFWGMVRVLRRWSIGVYFAEGEIIRTKSAINLFIPNNIIINELRI